MPDSNGPPILPAFLPGRPVARRLILGIVGHILEEDGDILTRWRARLTASILLATLLLSAFPAYNTVNYLVRAGLHWQGAANLLIGAGVAWLLLSRLPTNRLRGWVLSWTCIAVGAVSLATLGPFSAGLVWLYTGVLLATFLLGPRPAAWALGAVLLVLTGVCFGIEWELLAWAADDPDAILRWRMVAYNMGLLVVVLAGANALIMHLLEEEEQARTAAEHRLGEARRHEAVGTLASGIAHDFNNLLVPILGNLESVRSGLPSDSEAEGALRDVERAALRGRELVQQILTFGRSGIPRSERVEVGRVAGEVARLLEVGLPPGVRIEVAPGRDDCTVVASEVQIHQVLQNLVTNACHAVEAGGVVRIELGLRRSSTGDRVQIQVVDNGVGMSPETRDRVFDPYFSTRAGDRGTGLGLPIVRRIVQELGGDITVSSRLGQGSAFIVDLPAAPSGPAEGGIPAAAGWGGDLFAPSPQQVAEGDAPDDLCGGLRILVVDDESAVRRALARMLAALGCGVTEAGSVLEARALLDRDDLSFDLLLTDFRMPGESGVHLIRDVLRRHPHLAVLLASGNFDEARREADGLRGVTFLQKPFDLRELSRAVREAVAHRDASFRPGVDAERLPL